MTIDPSEVTLISFRKAYLPEKVLHHSVTLSKWRKCPAFDNKLTEVPMCFFSPPLQSYVSGQCEQKDAHAHVPLAG